MGAERAAQRAASAQVDSCPLRVCRRALLALDAVAIAAAAHVVIARPPTAVVVARQRFAWQLRRGRRRHGVRLRQRRQHLTAAIRVETIVANEVLAYLALVEFVRGFPAHGTDGDHARPASAIVDQTRRSTRGAHVVHAAFNAAFGELRRRWHGPDLVHSGTEGAFLSTHETQRLRRPVSTFPAEGSQRAALIAAVHREHERTGNVRLFVPPVLFLFLLFLARRRGSRSRSRRSTDRHTD